MSDQPEFDFNAPLPKMSAAEALEKIKKLLRLGRSSNPHEAGLALERAFALAARHRIDVSSLDLDEETERLVHEWFKIGLRLSFLQKRALNIVVHFFSVDVCYWRPRIVFVGTPSDIAIAWYVYEFLVQQGQQWLADFNRAEKLARRKVSKTKSQNFVQGFIYGISNQLRQREKKIVIEDSKTALVLAEQKRQREAKIDDLLPGNKPVKVALDRRNESALMRGFVRGEQTRINQPLGNKERLSLEWK
jgi:hypothetical protein